MCRIDNIVEHPNADRLEVAVIKGWNCIVEKNVHKIGDLITFVPPDSIIPDDLINKYELEHLRKGGRVRTVKLRGYVSQGLVLPVPKGNYKEGDDVAKVLGITKYEVPEPSYSKVNTGQKKKTKKRPNPLFDKYTDMGNIQNYNNVFKEGDLVIITEKIHGANARYSCLPITKGVGIIDRIKYHINKFRGNDYEFLIGSHNVQITHHTKRNSFYGDDIWTIVAKKYDLENKIPKDYILYGEVYGQQNEVKVQDLTYGVNELSFVAFDVKYKGEYVDRDVFEEFCKSRDIPIAPILYQGQWNNDLIEKYTEGKSLICPTQMREGFVVKSFFEENDFRIGRKILKSISKEYLLRKNGTEFH